MLWRRRASHLCLRRCPVSRTLQVCRVCLREQPDMEFYRGRRICKDCYTAIRNGKYSARIGFSERCPFTCRDCGNTYSAKQESRSTMNLCKRCHLARILARKAAAPEKLKCNRCGQEKPKEEFEKYSLTRCKVCAAEAVRNSNNKRRTEK